jgi:hypothetical protein
MRGLWRVIALIAEDANSFNNRLASIANQVTNPNLKNGVALNTAAPIFSLDLQPQPTPAILQLIDSYLRSVDNTLILTAYELAEVNRIVCEARTNEVPPHKSLRAYWQGLDAVGRRNQNSHGFMEAVGGLAVDHWTRSQFAAGHLDLTTLFDLTAVPQGDLHDFQNKLVAGSPSDLAAANFAALGWRPKCVSVITMAADWIHVNA